MFAIMFLAIVLELIASMGTFGSLVAQNLYTNSAAGWYIRLDWTAVYTYAVTVFSILISFSLTVGALARNASGSKRTCSSWFNPFAIFLMSFILSVLWVVIAGFAYRNPLPMRYPCDIFRHLRGSLEMLGLTSGKSLIEEGGLLVGICQSSKAFLVLAGVGLGLWILILILSCVAMGTGLEPPSKKSSHSSTNSSRRSIRTVISSIASRMAEKRRPSNLGSFQQQATCHSCHPPNPAPLVHPEPSLPPAAAAAATNAARTRSSYNNARPAYNGCADKKCYYRPSSCYNAACLQTACLPHQCQTDYAVVKSTTMKPQQCAPACSQNPRPQNRIYTHHRNRHSAAHNIARTPSFASQHSDAGKYNRNMPDIDGAAPEAGHGKSINNSEYGDMAARQLEASPHAFQPTEEESSHPYSGEYAGNYSPHHLHYHHNHNSHSEQDDPNNALPQSNQSRRQKLKQLFNRDAEHQV